MITKLARFVRFLLIGLLTVQAAFAFSPVVIAAPLTDIITYDEFRSLAEELSFKVSLFEEVWKRDPGAEFFGGTSRDYLYWLRREFQNLPNREAALVKMKELREADFIDIRNFIVGDSDIDVATQSKSLSDLASIFKVRKIDPIDRARFLAGSPEAQSEINQGWIPVEKIRLGRNGFVDWPGFGNGVQEIYDARPTAHFSSSEAFARTLYVAKGKNHRVFLALRFLRILALNDYYLHGRNHPNTKELFDIDEESAKQTREVIEWATEDPELKNLLKKEAFRTKINDLILKTFRSYTNPTAARLLYEHFHVDILHAKHSKQLEPINQTLFAKPPISPEIIQERLQEFGYSSLADIFLPPHEAFPNLTFFHGVRSGKAAFRSIVLEGALPSDSSRTAGRGLYGVSESNKEDAIKWAGTPSLVIQADVNAQARVADISRGEGERLFQAFKRKYGGDIDAFVDYFGIQILKYKYPYFPAFVVKDSSALGKPRGMTQDVRSVSEILEEAEKIGSHQEAFKLIRDLGEWGLTPSELKLVHKTLISPWLIDRPPEPRSLSEALDIIALPLHSVMKTTDIEMFHAKIPFERLLEEMLLTQPSLSEIEKLFLHPGIYYLTNDRIKLLKSKLVVPALKKEAAKITDWRELETFLGTTQRYRRARLNFTAETSGESELQVRLDLYPAQRAEVFRALAIPWLHDNPRSALVKRMWETPNIFGHTSAEEIAERFTFALTLSGFFISDPLFSSNPSARQAAQAQLHKALSDIFGTDKSSGSRSTLFHIGLGAQMVSFSEAARSNPEVAKNIVKVLNDAARWKRNKGLIRRQWKSLLYILATPIFVQIAYVMHQPYLYGFALASGLLGTHLLHKYMTVAKEPMKDLAANFARSAKIPCGAQIRGLARSR